MHYTECDVRTYFTSCDGIIDQSSLEEIQSREWMKEIVSSSNSEKFEIRIVAVICMSN